MTVTDPSRVSVIYVGGAVRSGTTIVDMLFGMNPNALAIGEINLLFRQYVRKDNPVPCSCGKLLTECPLWSEVAARFQAALPDISFERAHAITQKVESFPTARDAHLFWDDYTKIWRVMMDSVVEISGATCIIDSSKSSMHSMKRPLNLAKMGYKTGMLHMIRDVRAVTWSKLRRDLDKNRVKGNPALFSYAAYAALHWSMTNVGTNWLYARQKQVPYYKVRYEDFMENPVEKLREMEKVFGVDLQRSIEIVQQDGEIDSGHLASGNEIRLKAPLHLRKQPPTWKEGLPSAAKLGVVTSLPVARFYNYHVTDYR